MREPIEQNQAPTSLEIEDVEEWRENSRIQTDRLEAIAAILEAISEFDEPWRDSASLTIEVQRLALTQAAEILRGRP